MAAAAILLTGALAARTAARRVVEPPAGETWSAGEVSVPTVFGQTAEEVLFYPWSLYDAQTLYAIPNESLENLFGVMALSYTVMHPSDNAGATDPSSEWEVNSVLVLTDLASSSGRWNLSLFNNFSLIRPVKFQWGNLLRALEWNVPPDGASAQPLHIYLKDLNASAYLGKAGANGPATPVRLSFAYSASNKTSVSFLIRPLQSAASTVAQQEAAMEKVDSQLRSLFLSPNAGDTELGALLQSFLDYNTLFPEYRCDLRKLILENLFDGWERYSLDVGWRENVVWPEELEDESLPLDKFLTTVESMGSLTVQCINTQSQIVVLLTVDSGEVLGAYYDIQLDCWSGVGYTE